jgi:hypothetical protein
MGKGLVVELELDFFGREGGENVVGDGARMGGESLLTYAPDDAISSRAEGGVT